MKRFAVLSTALIGVECYVASIFVLRLLRLCESAIACRALLVPYRLLVLLVVRCVKERKEGSWTPSFYFGVTRFSTVRMDEVFCCFAHCPDRSRVLCRFDISIKIAAVMWLLRLCESAIACRALLVPHRLLVLLIMRCVKERKEGSWTPSFYFGVTRFSTVRMDKVFRCIRTTPIGFVFFVASMSLVYSG